jgi:hypothetical protein
MQSPLSGARGRVTAFNVDGRRELGTGASLGGAAAGLPEKGHRRLFSRSRVLVFRVLFRGALSRVRFGDNAPLAMSAPDCPHHFMGAQRLRKHVMPSKIQHLCPKPVIGQARRDDNARRPSKSLYGPKDVPPGAIGQRVLTDHDRRKPNQINRVPASPTDKRSAFC